MRVVQGSLDNGLEVVIHPRDAAPVVSVYLWLEVGTLDEEPAERGVAHFLEHLVFKGTESYGLGEAARAIEAVGGDLNAFTSYDNTALHATVPSAHWRVAVDVLAEMAQTPLFDAEELERERQVVLDEIRTYASEPDSVLSDEMALVQWPGHGYGAPILGTEQTVAGLTRDQVRSFWSTHWCPNRAVLAVAGDVEPSEVLAHARQRLAAWPAGAPRLTAPHPDVATPSTVHLDTDFDTPLLELSFRTGGIGDLDLPVLDVLAAALGQGNSALLTRRLQREKRLALAAWASVSPRRLGGTFQLGLMPMPGRTAEALAEVYALLEHLPRLLSEADIRRARKTILADLLFGAETTDGLAHDLAWYHVHTGSIDGRAQFADAVARVRLDDVRRVVRRCLVPDTAVVGILDDQLDAGTLPAPPKLTSTQTAPRGHEPRLTTLANGMRVLLAPDPSPVAALYMAATGGRLMDLPAGTGQAWVHMLDSGADGLDANDWAAALDETSATIDGMWGRSTSGLQATAPADDFPAAIDLLQKLVEAPAFDRDEWERVQHELITDLDTLGDRPSEIASMTMWQALFPEHPWRRRPIGTASSLKALTPTRLRSVHHRLFTPDNAVIAVSGGFDEDALLEQLSQWTLASAPAVTVPPVTVGPTQRQLVRRAGHEQAIVMLGAQACALSHPDREVWRLIATLLGGQSGRLFMSLRERDGLAYNVWAQATDGLPGGAFTVGIATDPAKLKQAEAGLLAQLRMLADAGPTPEEIERNITLMIGQTAMSLQRAAGRAANHALCTLYGLPWDLEDLEQRLRAVTPADIQRVLGGTLDQGLVQLRVLPE